MDKYFNHIVHGGDYNPDQWINTKEIWDEDVRLMKLAGVNNATVGIFSWAKLEPEEGVFDFSWLDEIMDKLYANGIDVILATPSGARPVWLAQKYPEVLRVEENGIRNEYGVRHNHCLTSPVYREKVAIINRKLAEHYKNHPALKMWHISNEYSGECHCELCRAAFREWLRKYYKNDIKDLNERWWNGFWSHDMTDFSQLDSPKYRGENHVSAMKLAWKRFLTDSYISFYENETKALKECTPDIPITTNFMRMYSGFDYQKMAEHVDIMSWDNYPDWPSDTVENVGAETAFVHDVFRSMKGGKPFFMMESTPSIVNWKPVNKIPAPGTHALASIQAVAHGADSVQYFQWRKSRGSHEKFHGAVVDHEGTENTRVFREVAALGKDLAKLDEAAGTRTTSKVAVICDWEEKWATEYFNGYNNSRRDYVAECLKWHTPFLKRGIPVDVIPMDADYSKYDLIIAPFLYMLKDGTDKKIEDYVADGGRFVMTYLSGVVDSDDRTFLGGFPANDLKSVFGIWAEETDSIPENYERSASFNGKSYKVDHICDIIHARTAKVLGQYETDFYAGMPSVTVNDYKNGKAYYVAFRNDADLADDFCNELINEMQIKSDAEFEIPENVFVRKRGELTYIMNFSEEEKIISNSKTYTDILSGETINGDFTVKAVGYKVIR